MTPAPSSRHQTILFNLTRILGSFVHERHLGHVLFAPLDVLFSAADVVQPDLLFISRQRSAIIQEACIQGAPDLVVEILSPATRRRDAVVKRKLYEKFGVAEYWLVDPELEKIEVYRGGAGGFTRAAEAGREEKTFLTSPLFPGLELSLDEVFA